MQTWHCLFRTATENLGGDRSAAAIGGAVSDRCWPPPSRLTSRYIAVPLRFPAELRCLETLASPAGCHVLEGEVAGIPPSTSVHFLLLCFHFVAVKKGAILIGFCALRVRSCVACSCGGRLLWLVESFCSCCLLFFCLGSWKCVFLAGW